MNYLENLNEEIREYFKILSPVFPEWLLEYIDTKEMQRIGTINLSCGTCYSKIFPNKYWHSNLDHSVGVALIIWNFTNDKKQTLAGLFHDIATPCFKHCIDFLNGDSETQESTEELTETILANSKDIMDLLHRDGIDIKEIADYHIYPIADNDTPRLSADRFEYTFSCGLVQTRIWELDTIKEMYENIIIVENEDGLPELAFNDSKFCEKYIHTISKIWPTWINDADRTVMQFIADIVKSMNVKGYLSINDLYTLSEEDVLNKIRTCEDKYIRESFEKFEKATSVYSSDTFAPGKYCISVKSKKRYIIPLTKCEDGKICRIDKVSSLAKSDIENFLNMKFSKYTGFDFDFKPYEKDDIEIESDKRLLKQK